MNSHLQRLWDNLDKLILAMLFLVLVGFHSHMISAMGGTVDPSDAEQIHWIENIGGQVLAALLTLLVTQKLGGAKEPAPAAPDGAASVPVPTNAGTK